MLGSPVRIRLPPLSRLELVEFQFFCAPRLCGAGPKTAGPPAPQMFLLPSLPAQVPMQKKDLRHPPAAPAPKRQQMYAITSNSCVRETEASHGRSPKKTSLFCLPKYPTSIHQGPVLHLSIAKIHKTDNSTVLCKWAHTAHS